MRRAPLVAATVMCMVGLFVSPAMAFIADNDSPVTLRYDYTQKVTAVLEISSGTATCTGKVSASNASNKVSIQVTLKKKAGTSWSYVDSWSGDGTGKAYKAIPYVNSYGKPGRNYKLAMRIPSGAPASTYTYKGKWSPDNELG